MVGQIRRGCMNDKERIEEIYALARLFMVEHGNPTQWEVGFPGSAQITEDISKGYTWVYEGEDATLMGCFSYLAGPDSDYATIRDGSWKDEGVYDVVHRFAVAQSGIGIGTTMMEFALANASRQGRALRIDTHQDNKVMQRLLARMGFVPCGTIRLSRTGDERIAFTHTPYPVSQSLLSCVQAVDKPCLEYGDEGACSASTLQK